MADSPMLGLRGPQKRSPNFNTPVKSRTHDPVEFRAMSDRLSGYFDPNSNAGFPLARLGIALSSQDDVRRWKSAIGPSGGIVRGEYFSGDFTDEKTRGVNSTSTNPIRKRQFDEMGLDPSNTTGQIGLDSTILGRGDRGGINNTFEHEMMHKAINEALPDSIPERQQELLIRLLIGGPHDKEWVNGRYRSGFDSLKEQNLGLLESIEENAKEKLLNLSGDK